MSTKGLDAVAAATEPRKSLISYLLSAYPLKDPHLKHGFRELLEVPGAIAQDPYLEGTQPYETSKTLQELVNNNILDKRLLAMFDPQRPLYSHQERAITAAIKEEANIVVATGTGSGKTECFLIPMLNRLITDQKPGVQALILYPMNALVNDQVKRLRRLLCQQTGDIDIVRFGFYTSRTKQKQVEAEEALKEELIATEREELLELFNEKDRKRLLSSPHAVLVQAAHKQVLRVQVISREQIQAAPPQILVTNYSMLEHMLMRPTERTEIFGKSKNFRILILDEAHTYNGSTGTEVAMLVRRFKKAVGIVKTGEIQAIATSASLGDPSDPNIKEKVTEFASQLFDEQFNEVIWGNRVDVNERLGKPYELPRNLDERELYEYAEELDTSNITESIDACKIQLSSIVPAGILQKADSTAEGDVHRFLWEALAGHPLIHRLIRILSDGPQPWSRVATNQRLWSIPLDLDGEVEKTERSRLERGLSNLIQLGTMARRGNHQLPLVPIRLHLLFRSLEGLYACINPECKDAPLAPNIDVPQHYGRMYLSSQSKCSCCDSPVIELSSCRKCGEAFGVLFAPNKRLASVPRNLEDLESRSDIFYVTTIPPLSVSNDEESDDDDINEDDNTIPEPNRLNGGCKLQSIEIIKSQDDWLLQLQAKNSDNSHKLYRYQPKSTNDDQGAQLSCCPACGAKRKLTGSVGRFTSFTDAPLAVMLDRTLELLNLSGDADQVKASPKILTFSDGRQDAAFFASDFQRTHTENLYRQCVWSAFQATARDGKATIGDVEKEITQYFLTTSIPHPDRIASIHHKSYVDLDRNEGDGEARKGRSQCEESARSRARELLLREFGLPSARRFSIEAFGLLACHIGEIDQKLRNGVIKIFAITGNTADPVSEVFITMLTDQIRLLGAVDLKKASNYFPETGGVTGGMRGILGPKGQSKVYLKQAKLDKEKKETNILQFKPRRKNDLSFHPVQNRIIDYCRKFFGAVPDEMQTTELYELLVDTRILGSYTDGHQLGWDQLLLYQSNLDWFQCDCCRQLFHQPGLTQLSIQENPLAFSCPSYKCMGSLNQLDTSSFTEEHYRTLIQKTPLPIRAAEHTAQLETEDLLRRENRFRRGQINLLSSTTTLEMGVDIGELQVVAMRNFPPLVSNYQQRAGRAGRRSDGVAVTLMYGQRRPHDRYYFEHPRRLIAGSNQVPNLDTTNYSIQRRHIQAELLAHFLHKEYHLGAEKVEIGIFIGLPTEDEDLVEIKEGTEAGLFLSFKNWLQGDHARNLSSNWLAILKAEALVDDLLVDFLKQLEKFIKQQQVDWNGHASNYNEVHQEWIAVRDNRDANSQKQSKRLDAIRSAIISQISKIRKRELHRELASSSILPIYGFPIDVVQLLTQANDIQGHSRGGHKLQRDRRLALSEYAPGQEVVVDDRVHKSVGVVRAGDLETFHYWVCETCNYFKDASTKGEVEKWLLAETGDLCCPICTSPVKSAKKPTRAYKVPRAFTTDWNAEPQITPFRKPTRQPTSQVFLAQTDSDAKPMATEFFELVSSQGGTFFLSNQGPSRRGRSFSNPGYALCSSCGLDLSDDVITKVNSRNRGTKSSFDSSKEHVNPITQKQCNGRNEYIHLAHRFTSDLLKIRFSDAAQALPLYQTAVSSDDDNKISGDVGLPFWRSLTYAFLAAAADVIDVSRSELDGLFRPIENRPGMAELIIYDNVASGAGHSKKIGEQFLDVLKSTLELVSSCSCSSSCYDCLRTYTNQMYHDQLDRFAVRRFLEPIVGQLSPDDAQQQFASHSSYIETDQLSTMLEQAARMARANTVISVPKLGDRFTTSYLKLAIDQNRLSGTPVQLILREIPDHAGDHSSAVLRKRLSQWIDQGALELYQQADNLGETYCFASTHPSRIAFHVISAEPGAIVRSLETRSEEGVGQVLERLQRLILNSKLIGSKNLEDPDTDIAFLEPSNQILSIADIRDQIGLAKLFAGRKLASAQYSDRYFECRNSGHALFFGQLLEGPWVTPETVVRVFTNQLREEAESNDDSRLSRIKHDFSTFAGSIDLDVSWRFYSQPRKRLLHRRELTLKFTDGSAFIVLSDKGLDFLHADRGGYRLTDHNYIVITPG